LFAEIKKIEQLGAKKKFTIITPRLLIIEVKYIAPGAMEQEMAVYYSTLSTGQVAIIHHSQYQVWIFSSKSVLQIFQCKMP